MSSLLTALARIRSVLLLGLSISSLTSYLIPRAAVAQAAPLTAGETVLISWRDPVVVGALSPYHKRRITVLRTDARQIVGRLDGRTQVIDGSAIIRIRRKIGTRPPTAPEMVAGSAIGFGTGFLIGAIGASTDRVDAGLSTGVLLGAPAGALVAWVASRSRGIYEDVPLPGVRVARGSTGRIRLDVLGRLVAP
jgi:hypothetical protein